MEWAGLVGGMTVAQLAIWAEITYSIDSAAATADPNGRLRRKPRNCVWQPIPWGLGG